MSIPGNSLNKVSGHSPVSEAMRPASSPMFGGTSTIESRKDSYSGRRRGQSDRPGAFSRMGQWFGRKWVEFKVWLHGGSVGEEMPRLSLKKRIMGKMTLAGAEMYLQKHPGMNLLVKGVLPTAAVVGTGALLHQGGTASKGIGEMINSLFSPPARKGLSTTSKVALGTLGVTAAGVGTHQLIKHAVAGAGQTLVDKNIEKFKQTGEQLIDKTAEKLPLFQRKGWFS